MHSWRSPTRSTPSATRELSQSAWCGRCSFPTASSRSSCTRTEPKYGQFAATTGERISLGPGGQSPELDLAAGAFVQEAERCIAHHAQDPDHEQRGKIHG